MSERRRLKERYPALVAALPAWLAARVLVVGAALAAGFFYYHGHSLSHALVGHERGLMAWDADWYLRIARDGYDSLPEEGLRYFPLYPVMARGLAALSGGATKVALLLISNSFALVLGALMYRLALHEKNDESLARRAAALTALTPPAFVLVMGYTEPLAMSFAVAAFLAMRRERWWWAAAAGLAAGLVRPTGLLLVAPLLIEAIRGSGSADRPPMLPRIAAVLSPIAGTTVYLAWSAKAFGDAFIPLTVQQKSNARGGFQFPLITFWHSLTQLLTDARVDQGLHLVWVGLFLFFIYLAFRHWPVSYGVFATISFLQAVSTSNLNSLERYCLGAFPVILAVAAVCRTPRSDRLLFAGSAVALTAYAFAAFISGYVP